MSKEENEGTPTLTLIQTELKAPKNNNNDFSHFKYRTSEDITKKLKPLLSKYGAKLYFTQEPIAIGNRFYIKTTATYIDDDGKLHVTAYAREPENKKGMDAPQVTGASSTYSLKKTLDLLFLTDDSADDPDANDNRQNGQPSKKANKKTNNIKTNFTNRELTEYTTSINGKKYKVIDIFKSALAGNEEATKWLTGTHPREEGLVINKLSAKYKNKHPDSVKKTNEVKHTENSQKTNSEPKNANMNNQQEINVFDQLNDITEG